MSVLLVGCLLSGNVLAAPVAANSGSVITGEVANVVLLDSPDVGNDDIESYGLKSASVKAAARKLAKMLRSGELEWVLERVEEYADARIAKLIRRHAVTIADTLDRLVKWSELSLLIIRQQLTGALHSTGLAHSTSTEIAFWIEKIIEYVLL